MNMFAIAAVVQSAIFKSVHKNYGFEVLDYFILRNVALFIVATSLVALWKIDLYDLPEERPRSYWLKIMVTRSIIG